MGSLFSKEDKKSEMSEEKPVKTTTNVDTKVEDKPDGSSVKTITTTTVDTFADGSSSTKTKVQTITSTPQQVMVSADGSKPVKLANDAKATAPKAEVTTDEKFLQDALAAHNRLRAKHGAPPMVLNREMCKISQAWANKLAAQNKMEHSTSGYGENCFFGSNDVTDGAVPVDYWYSEIKDYDFKKGDYVKGTGHFTQVVWKESKELGIAKALSKKGASYVVANYEPAGNFTGQFQKNVGKPN